MDAESPDPVAVLAALGLPGPARAIPVLGGLDATIWRVERDGAAFALRLLRPGHAAVAAREIAAMGAAAAAGVPVPAIHAAGTWRDRSALLLDWCPGHPMAEALAAQPWRAWSFGVAMGRAQAAIHAAPVPAAARDHPTPWLEWAMPDAALRRCLDAAPPRAPSLLHLDYHPLNVLVAGGRISAVLDWANARAGDPRADLARTASILLLGPAPDGPPEALVRLGRRALVAGWRRGYREAAGPVPGMAPFYAWAGAVMARDLGQWLGRPDIPWLTLDYLAGVHRWTEGWRQRAGCSG